MLGTFTSISTGNKPNDILSEGAFKYINAGTSESGYCDAYNTEGDMVTTPSRGQGGIGYVGYQFDKFWCGPLCYRINTDGTCFAKFLYYYLSCHDQLILQFKCEGGTPALNRKDLLTIEVAVPSLQRQQEIVSTLDTFESLISNIKQELDARKKQYEYYREKLLTFE